VGPRAGLNDAEKRKFLTPPGLELRHLGLPACSQSLYRLKLMPNYRPEVSLHPEGPATGQIDFKFSVVFLGPGVNTELVSKFHVALQLS
jgi:hypothetical protein